VIHDRIRKVECARSWQTSLNASRAVLAKRWSAADWAVEVSCLDFLGEFAELQASIERYLPHVERATVELRSFGFYILGRMYQSTGEYDIALAAYMRSLALGASAEMRALLLLQTSTINFFLGGSTEALTNLEFVRKDALRRGDAFSAAHAYDFLADLAFRNGDLKEATKQMRACRKQATLAGNQYRLDWARCLEGQILFEEGDHARGIALMEESRRAFEATGTRSSELHCCGRLGERLLRLGKLDEARPVIERGVALSAHFKYNLSRSKILRLHAQLRLKSGELSKDAYDQALVRASILEERAHKSWRLVHGRGRIYSEADVLRFLEHLEWELFEVVCQRILEYQGFTCTPTAVNENYLDIYAMEKVGTSRSALKWGVSCKRVLKGARESHVPDQTFLLSKGCKGFMIMTTGKVSKPAKEKLEFLETSQGIQTEIWDGPRISSFLAAHDWILADVGTMLPSRPPATSPKRRAKSKAAGRISS
jgi:tetratricopeptide (TPR) repeat protein